MGLEGLKYQEFRAHEYWYGNSSLLAPTAVLLIMFGEWAVFFCAGSRLLREFKSLRTTMVVRISVALIVVATVWSNAAFTTQPLRMKVSFSEMYSLCSTCSRCS